MAYVQPQEGIHYEGKGPESGKPRPCQIESLQMPDLPEMASDEKKESRTMTETSLIDIKKMNAVDVYGTEGGVDAVLALVNKAVADFEPDTASRQGRMEIASIAARVASSKTFLDGQGKSMVDPMKEQTKAIDAKRKHIRDTLDALKKEVRQPLTEWEEVEEARVAVHQKNISEIVGAGNTSLLKWDTLPLDAMRDRLAEIKAEESGEEHWGEFADMAEAATLQSIGEIRSAIEKREKSDAEKAEAQQLREEAQKREDADRQAAADARQAEIEANAKKQAEENAAREIDKAKAEALAQATKAADDAKAAAEQAKRDEELAVLKERERIETEQRVEDAAAADRKADEEYRNKIQTAAIDALVSTGCNAPTAKSVISAIAAGRIPNVKITY